MSFLPEDINTGNYLVARFPVLTVADESTATESSCGSPEPQLPAYDEERPPPKYQKVEQLVMEDEDERTTIAQQRRVLLIRLLACFFCLSIVMLIVAAAIVHANRLKKKAEELELEPQQKADLGLETPADDDDPAVTYLSMVVAVASTPMAFPFKA
ncbi:hypothetical protein J3F83DRAFT_715269 [Trichoderma novae-zelandiae]